MQVAQAGTSLAEEAQQPIGVKCRILCQVFQAAKARQVSMSR